MIAIPPTTSPAPNGGPAASDTDGTDPGLSALFASLVAALIGPGAASAAPAAAAAPATGSTPIASIGNDAATATSSVPTAASPAGSTTFALPDAGELAATATGSATPTTTTVMSAAATAISQAATSTTTSTVSIDAVDASAAQSAQTAPVPSAAAVIQARQPLNAKSETPAAEESEGTTDADEASSPTATTAPRPSAEDDEDVDDINAATDTATAQAAAVDQPALTHGVGDIAGPTKTHGMAPAGAVEAHQQIAAVVSPLRRRGDGSYQLTLHLKPEHLGNVDLHVDLHHDTVDLHMHADNQHAHDLLVEHLDDLRHELEQGGLRAGSFDVETGDQRQQAQSGATAQRPAFAPVQTAEPELIDVTTVPADDSTVDVRA